MWDTRPVGGKERGGEGRGRSGGDTCEPDHAHSPRQGPGALGHSEQRAARGEGRGARATGLDTQRRFN